MKQKNSIIASLLVSGLLVLSMVGIGANALANPAGTTASAANASFLLTSNASNSATGSTRRESGEHRSRTGTSTTNNQPVQFNQ